MSFLHKGSVWWLLPVPRRLCVNMVLIQFSASRLSFLTPVCFLTRFPAWCRCQIFDLCFGQCSGSVTFWYGFGSCSHWQWLSRCQQKVSFFPSLFCLILTVGTLISVFKDNKSQKTVEGVVCLNTGIFLIMEGSGSVWIIMDPDPKTYGSGSGTLPVFSPVAG